MMIQIYNDDCLNKLKSIKSNSINLTIADLPYGQTNCEWDIKIDLKKMWDELRRVSKANSIFIFFCTTKFGIELLNSNPRHFKYDLIWEKSNAVGFLNNKIMPLRKHEMIYLFNNDDNKYSKYKNLELRKYFGEIITYIGVSGQTIIKKYGYRYQHCFTKGQQFSLPTQKSYNDLIEIYKIDKMKGFKEYKVLKKMWQKNTKKIYNPQLKEGKPYIKKKIHTIKGGVYGFLNEKENIIKNDGFRQPTSVLKFNNPVKSYHNTQKPVELLKWLILTYSNEGDTILDPTMGSGSLGISCLETNRKFIGIEMDKNIYRTGRDRLLNYEIENHIKIKKV